jgi:hypothetical protein
MAMVMAIPMAPHGVMAMAPMMAVTMRPALGGIGDFRRRTGVDAKHAFDPADHTADDAADHRANRSCATITLVNAMRDAAWNALRLRRDTHDADHGEDAKSKHCQFHMEFL